MESSKLLNILEELDRPGVVLIVSRYSHLESTGEPWRVLVERDFAAKAFRGYGHGSSILAAIEAALVDALAPKPVIPPRLDPAFLRTLKGKVSLEDLE